MWYTLISGQSAQPSEGALTPPTLSDLAATRLTAWQGGAWIRPVKKTSLPESFEQLVRKCFDFAHPVDTCRQPCTGAARVAGLHELHLHLLVCFTPLPPSVPHLLHLCIISSSIKIIVLCFLTRLSSAVWYDYLSIGLLLIKLLELLLCLNPPPARAWQNLPKRLYFHWICGHFSGESTSCWLYMWGDRWQLFLCLVLVLCQMPL